MKKDRKRKRFAKRRPGSLPAALCLTILIFSAAVVLTLNSRWLYALDVSLLRLDEISGMSREEIKANYDALISYNSLFYRGALAFPTLAMSEAGRIHFRECKRIFAVIQAAGLICLAGTVLLLIRWRRGRDRAALRLAGILTLAIPALLGILAALDWNRFFITFHHLLFRNDYWLFDPDTDPVILILPEQYFLHCAVLILLLIAAGGILCLLAGRRGRKR